MRAAAQLRAADAAMGFAERRRAGAAPAWKSVKLSWRRNRPALRAERNAAMARSIAHTTWSPQFHVHYNTHVRQEVVKGAAEFRQIHLLSERMSGNQTAAQVLRSAARQFAPRFAPRWSPARTDWRHSKLRSRPAISPPASQAHRTTETRRVPQSYRDTVGETPLAPYRAPEPNRINRHRPAPEVSPLSPRRRPRPQMEFAGVDLRVSAPRPAPSRLRREVAGAPSVELIWRTPKATRIAEQDVANSHDLATHARSATLAPAPPAPAPPMISTQARPAAPRIDAAMLDRLTDDVIRRVEKKMRIERERRGL